MGVSDVVEGAIQRLESLGYQAVEEDRYALEFAVQKVSWKIQTECNLREIPPALRHVALDMVCGEFLCVKKNTGQLDCFDAQGAVQAIKEGDTQITYAVSGAQSPLEQLIRALKNDGAAQLLACRRLSW